MKKKQEQNNNIFDRIIACRTENCNKCKYCRRTMSNGYAQHMGRAVQSVETETFQVSM